MNNRIHSTGYWRSRVFLCLPKLKYQIEKKYNHKKSKKKAIQNNSSHVHISMNEPFFKKMHRLHFKKLLSRLISNVYKCS